MATMLNLYTKILALLAAALAALWGWLAYDAPLETSALFGSDLLMWGPTIWFAYLTLRFGHSRSAARFYFRAMRPVGRAGVVIFGILTIGTMAIGTLMGVMIAFPEFTVVLAQWGLVAAFSAAALYAIVAHFGARPLVYRTGLVRFEGEPVLRPGTRIAEGVRFPYRG